MPATEAITLALAAFGAAGTVAQIYTTIRDRPRLRLDATTTTSMDAPPSAKLIVLNVGNRPTTAREIGFYAHESEAEIRDEAGNFTFSTDVEIHAVVARGIFLEPGQAQEFDATQPVLAMGVWADEPLRLYAKDIHDRRVWGPAARVVRVLFDEDPPLDDMPEDFRRIFDPPPDQFRLPAQVEARWKFWKKRELRNPKRWKGD